MVINIYISVRVRYHSCHPSNIIINYKLYKDTTFRFFLLTFRQCLLLPQNDLDCSLLDVAENSLVANASYQDHSEEGSRRCRNVSRKNLKFIVYWVSTYEFVQCCASNAVVALRVLGLVVCVVSYTTMKNMLNDSNEWKLSSCCITFEAMLYRSASVRY